MSGSPLEPTEIVPWPGRGRRFEGEMRPGIADVVGDGRRGRARLDAIARWLQDLAYQDLVEAGFEGRGAWVVRRTRIRVASFPAFGEELRLATFCSAIGRFCAERRTTVEGAVAALEAVSLWVCLDPESLRPMRFEEDFLAAYRESAAGRSASVRLRHAEPPGDAPSRPWAFRATDIDLAGHVNNSHYWSALEEELAATPERSSIDAELEHRAPARAGEAALLGEGGRLWISSPEGELHASIVVF
jgi:acyl-ACP thioesterase